MRGQGRAAAAAGEKAYAFSTPYEKTSPSKGAPLGRLEARVVLEELSARLPQLRLVSGQTLRFQPNTSMRGPLSLLVEWDV